MSNSSFRPMHFADQHGVGKAEDILDQRPPRALFILPGTFSLVPNFLLSNLHPNSQAQYPECLSLQQHMSAMNRALTHCKISS